MKTYYINLDYRQDRNESTKKVLKKLNIEAVRFEAIKYTSEEKDGYETGGERGCFESHLAILKNHYNSNSTEDLLILEDDIELILRGQKNFSRVLKKLKSVDWAVCYLGGGNSTDITNLEKTISKADGSWGTTGIIYKTNYIGKIIDMLEKAVKDEKGGIDAIYINKLNSVVSNKIYMATPKILFQKHALLSNINEPASGLRRKGDTKYTKCFYKIVDIILPFSVYIKTHHVLGKIQQKLTETIRKINHFTNQK